ncbi:signal peptidase I [Coprobacter tertius]|uniref:Signal peptidase I n=1 Tax=Coprobacter tertius TaxID=2944915 RepID=A0ABT1MKN6_9BACT|nr:signal peptidase I [Coprobacter tertius]MCP9611811.1 signal peptidase I [Coprobacter tertius]
MRSKVIKIFFVFIGTLLLAIFIRLTIGEPCSVNSPSMEPTIMTGDWLWIDRLTYGGIVPRRWSDIPIINIFTWIPALRNADAGNDWGYRRFPGFRKPDVDDVVVFRNPENEEILYVKRIEGILVCGEAVRIDSSNYNIMKKVIEKDGNTIYRENDKIYINGVILKFYAPMQNFYFVLGDNRSNSLDSREYGYIPESSIVGRMSRTFFSIGENGIRKDRFWHKIE